MLDLLPRKVKGWFIFIFMVVFNQIKEEVLVKYVIDASDLTGRNLEWLALHVRHLVPFLLIRNLNQQSARLDFFQLVLEEQDNTLINGRWLLQADDPVEYLHREYPDI